MSSNPLETRRIEPNGGEKEPEGFFANLIDFLEGARGQTENPAWAYLLHHMDGYTGMWAAAGLEASKRADEPPDELLGRIIEQGVTEPELLRRLRDHLDSAPISWERRKQLNKGLSFAAEGDHDLAVPMLQCPLEGAFWRAAEERGLVEQNPDGKWFRKEPPKKPIAITEVFKLDGMDVDDRFIGFARGLVYGRVGNQHRHGTAEDGWRLRSLCLVVALVEWLDLQGLADARDEIKGAFIRASKQRRETRRAADDPVTA